MKYCLDHDFVKPKMPKEDGKQNILYFYKDNQSHEIPYVLYCDFESINQKIYGAMNND